jgi:hypothetical protein
MSMAIESGFEPLSESDLPLIARWLQAPHVAQWWPDRLVDTPYGRTLLMVCRR